MGPQKTGVRHRVSKHKIALAGDSKSQRKLNHWFKSYSNFAGGVDFACWWNCIRKGLRLQPAQLNYLQYSCNIALNLGDILFSSF